MKSALERKETRGWHVRETTPSETIGTGANGLRPDWKTEALGFPLRRSRLRITDTILRR
jgi:hypothetical protein